jgi:hypothetical protein
MADTSPSTDVGQASSDDHAAAVEFYETDEGTVFYDTDNPLAWIQSRTTLTVDEIQ